MTEGKRGRGRPKMTEAEKAEAKAAREAAKANGDMGHNSIAAYSNDERFALLVEIEPRIAEAETAKAEAALRVKEEIEALTAVYGSAAVAKKQLALFRRAQTDEGAAEARALVDMHQRVAQWQRKPIGYIADMFAPEAANAEMHVAA